MACPSGTLTRMDILIRPAVPADYEPLGEITAQAYLEDGLLLFGESDWYLDELKDVAKRASAADVLVATANDDLLGGVTFVPSGGPLADLARPGEAEIRMLAVAHAARGRGVGQALVQACVDRASGRRPPAVVLCTQPTMHTAHRIYERLGFTRAPERDWQPDTRRRLHASHLPVDALKSPRHNIWGCFPRPAQDVCSCSLSPQGNPVRIRNCPATV